MSEVNPIAALIEMSQINGILLSTGIIDAIINNSQALSPQLKLVLKTFELCRAVTVEAVNRDMIRLGKNEEAKGVKYTIEAEQALDKLMFGKSS